MQSDKQKFKKEFINRLIVFSVGANVVEAKAASSKRDYIKYFEIALKSANETKYWFMVIAKSDPKVKQTADKLLNEAVEISKIIGSSVLTLKGKKNI